MTLDLPDGKQIVVNSDLGTIRLSLWAYRGSLGVSLTPDQAKELGLALWQIGRRKPAARIEAGTAKTPESGLARMARAG
jgi:hypothetical protein